MTPAVDITLKNGTPAETRARGALLELLTKHDLTGWIFTNAVEVDETAWPHSHPVLTLNTQHTDNESMFLAEFLHEQLHWFEEERATDRDGAILETARYYSSVPSARPEGAGDEGSTRLHLLVCFLEYQALKRLQGNKRARRTITALSRHHYCWVYRTVLRDERKIEAIIRKFGLLPEPLLRVAEREVMRLDESGGKVKAAVRMKTNEVRPLKYQ